MIKAKLIIAVILTTISSISFSQDMNYAVSLIPDSLKENANVVIRQNIQELIINGESGAVLKIKEARTILKKSGEGYAYVVVPYSKFIKIKGIKEKVYDKNGKLLWKVKNKEILDISRYDGFSLYSDNRLKLIRIPAVTPPYTVEVEYERSYKGILYFPDWYPIPGYKISVQNSNLKIISPQDYSFRNKSENFTGKKSKKIVDDNVIYTWEIKNYKAIENEPYNTSIDKLVPHVLIAPNDFKLDNYKGNAESWESFGEWISQLNSGRDVLPEETVKKIRDLTKNAKNNKEKAKIVYEYMQNKTRYVNIAIGIGGWQPFEAKDTDKNGYGDCKALSFYTKSLLDAVGVRSHYVIIKAGVNEQKIKTDFPSTQFNHATLCVPYKNDTIWLECTSQTNPFGYIGTFTDDRNALLIDENGKGKIVHTTVYPEEVNTQIRNANFKLDSLGNISGEVETKYSGLQYENLNRLLIMSKEDQKKKLDKLISIPNLKIESFYFDEKKDLIPSIKENIKLNIQNYASLGSNRLFLVPNVLNRQKHIPKKLENRKSNVVFKRGFIDIDTIVFELPKNYKIEFLPKNISEKNKFGIYKVNYSIENNKLIYVRKHIIHKGTFPPEDYEKLRVFLKLVYKNDKKSIVFVADK